MSSSPLTLPALELRHDWSTAEIQALLESIRIPRGAGASIAH